MTDKHETQMERRRFIRTAGIAALAVPLAGIAGCSRKEDTPPTARPPEPAPAPEPAAMAPQPAAATSQPPAAPTEAAEPLRLNLADPQAKALGYTHNATSVDAGAQPRYQAGQACQNCALFQGGAGDEWANCSIFPGRQVKATGWCSVYAPKAS